MKRPCIRISKRKAETTRKVLINISALDNNFRVKTDGSHVFFPVKPEKKGTLKDDFDIILESEFEERRKYPRSYKDIVEIPDHLEVSLPGSFDVLGDVAIIKLEDELLPYSGRIGEALLEANNRLRSVALDKGVKGEFRIRDLEVLAGENSLETIHIENNVRLKLDPSRVYFSPRLATERDRISKMTTGGRVLDMFAGVGPFSINLARNGDPEEVIGVDLNPDCIHYFKTNIELNSCGDKVTAFMGDSREAVHGMGQFDRIIMNLPHGAVEYFDTALSVMESGIIHVYSIIGSDDIRTLLMKISCIASKAGKNHEIKEVREVHNYSPTQSMMVLDVSIETNSSSR